MCTGVRLLACTVHFGEVACSYTLHHVCGIMRRLFWSVALMATHSYHRLGITTVTNYTFVVTVQRSCPCCHAPVCVSEVEAIHQASCDGTGCMNAELFCTAAQAAGLLVFKSTVLPLLQAQGQVCVCVCVVCSCRLCVCVFWCMYVCTCARVCVYACVRVHVCA